jgi:hypothetical protein
VTDLLSADLTIGVIKPFGVATTTAISIPGAPTTFRKYQIVRNYI